MTDNYYGVEVDDKWYLIPQKVYVLKHICNFRALPLKHVNTLSIILEYDNPWGSYYCDSLLELLTKNRHIFNLWVNNKLIWDTNVLTTKRQEIANAIWKNQKMIPVAINRCITATITACYALHTFNKHIFPKDICKLISKIIYSTKYQSYWKY